MSDKSESKFTFRHGGITHYVTLAEFMEIFEKIYNDAPDENANATNSDNILDQSTPKQGATP